MFIINYHTGVSEEVHTNNIEVAKEEAVKGIAYTQEKITIENEHGHVLTTSYWYGVEPDENEQVLERVGNGFYRMWDDEL